MNFDDLNFSGKSHDMYLNKNMLGKMSDMSFFEKDDWLLDAEVTFSIHKEDEMWSVYLVFSAAHNNYKFIRKKINSFHSKSRAKLCAEVYEKSSRNDLRDDINLKTNTFSICNN